MTIEVDGECLRCGKEEEDVEGKANIYTFETKRRSETGRADCFTEEVKKYSLFVVRLDVGCCLL
jgi:hypothetical protein